MKCLGITGANGMLGKDLCQVALNQKFKINAFDLPGFDITKQETRLHIVKTSDIIINCAAYTAVDQAEIETDKCYQINAEAVKELGQLAAKNQKPIIHISTDFVFGDSEKNRPLNEEDKTNPLGIYGKSKLLGEQHLISSGASFTILRVEWTYGIYGNNFISKIVERASREDKLTVVNDQFGCPTSTVNISKAILCLIKANARGLFHFAEKGYASRYEVAQYIFKTLNIKKELTQGLSSDFPTAVNRPKNSRFDCSKIDKILDFKRPHWKDVLTKYLKNIQCQNS